jgi:hypothetical protein
MGKTPAAAPAEPSAIAAGIEAAAAPESAEEPLGRAFVARQENEGEGRAERDRFEERS